MRIIRPPEPGVRGPLGWLGYWLKEIGADFYDLYDSIKDVWLLGD